MNQRTSMDFETAKECMDPLQVTDCLNKTLEFLKRNSDELRFPNIPTKVEAFLVNLVTDTRNLKCRFFTTEERSIALEIIEILEMSREVFRFTYAYENGKGNTKVLTYKKIYTNKMKKKRPARFSSVAHRLIQSVDSDTEHVNLLPNQQDPTIPTMSTSFKLSFLNRTLRFIKNDSERTLYYSEMPLPQAEYIQSVMQTNGDNDVGFGFKSLYAPLWEAMDQLSEVFQLKIALEVKEGWDYAALKLEKILKRDNSLERKDDNVSKADNIVENKVPEKSNVTNTKNDTLNEQESKSTGGKKKKKKQKRAKSVSSTITSSSQSTPSHSADHELISKLSTSFMRDTVQLLAKFAADEASASLTLDELTQHEMCFVRKVKGWAASPEERDKFTPEIRDLLLMLQNDVTQALRTYRITSTIREKNRSITLKKIPLFTVPSPPADKTPSKNVARSKSLAVPTAERSTSKNRTIQFQTAGVLEKEEFTKKPEKRGRSVGRMLSKGKAKLLEDLSTPVESDKGMRMMLLMGWTGGALGARGDGITEPLMPAINVASKAGLGHVHNEVKVRGPADFRLTFLENVSEMVVGPDTTRVVQYKGGNTLPKKERKFVPSTLQLLNCRRKPSASLGPAAADLAAAILQDLTDRPRVHILAELSKTKRTVTLRKVIKDQDNLTNGPVDVVITKEDIENITRLLEAESPGDTTKETKKHPGSIRKRAAKMLLMTTIVKVLRLKAKEIKFTFTENMKATWTAFVKNVIESLNTDKYSYVTDVMSEEERELYIEMRQLTRPFTVTVKFTNLQFFVLKKTPINDKRIINDPILPNGPKNNNHEKVDDRNGGQTDKHAAKSGNDDENQKEITSNVETSAGSSKLIAALEKIVSNSGDNSIINIDRINNCNNAVIDSDAMESNGDNPVINKNAKESYGNNAVNGKDGTEEKINNEIGTNKDIDVVIKEEIEENNDETDFEGNDCDYESDLDKEIKDLEIAICKAELEYKAKKQDTAQNDLEMTISDPDIDAQVKKEDASDLAMEIPENYSNVAKSYDTFPGNKRSSTNINSFEELDTKRSKLANSEHIIIITPNEFSNQEQDEKNWDFVKDVLELISDKICKTGYLPLLKCHGIQKCGFVYSCSSEEDVTWLKDVLNKAEGLDLKVDTGDYSCIAKEKTTVAMKIKTPLKLDYKQTLKRLENYNKGLDTKCWKNLLSRIVYNEFDTFFLIVVELDDKSLKYISDENFSLYCGIDEAHFTIL